MRDLNLNRVINVMAAGSILLAATVCGGPDKRLARKFCKGLYKCDRGEFEDSYYTRKDCIDEAEEYFEDGIEALEDYAGNKRADAAINAYMCSLNSYKKSCDQEDARDDC